MVVCNLFSARLTPSLFCALRHRECALASSRRSFCARSSLPPHTHTHTHTHTSLCTHARTYCNMSPPRRYTMHGTEVNSREDFELMQLTLNAKYDLDQYIRCPRKDAIIKQKEQELAELKAEHDALSSPNSTRKSCLVNYVTSIEILVENLLVSAILYYCTKLGWYRTFCKAPTYQTLLSEGE